MNDEHRASSLRVGAVTASVKIDGVVFAADARTKLIHDGAVALLVRAGKSEYTAEEYIAACREAGYDAFALGTAGDAA